MPDNYAVKRGDTLYSIAWRYGFDVRKLARANAISAPYTIYPGQTLRLREQAFVRSSKPAGSQASSGNRTPASAKTSSGSSKKPPASSQKVPAYAKVGHWRWPTTGKVVRGFSGTLHKGVDIDGEAGDAIQAVAAGKVVYAGSGIVGYGRLLIIKHNDVYLSAYGHNRRLLVGEGEGVNAGQQIAEKGSSATNSVKLHFEIRREGKPVDPATLLPSRCPATRPSFCAWIERARRLRITCSTSFRDSCARAICW